MITQPEVVLIIGGGPVGLTLALELGLRGTSVVLINEGTETSRHPKCNTVNARSMEHFRRLGIAETLRGSGLPGNYPTDVVYTTRLSRHELARLRMPASATALPLDPSGKDAAQTPEPQHRISQIYVERVLKERAEMLPSVRLRFGCRLEGFELRDDRVLARVVDEAARREEVIHARWMIGCDGARSRVRKLSGITFDGEGRVERAFMGGTMLSTYFRAPTLRGLLPHEPAWMYWTLNAELRSILVAIDGRELFLLHVQIPPGADSEAIDRQALIATAVGVKVPAEILSSATWTAPQSLVADRYRKGRVFLAGDAIHLFTPTGGFGLNTGIDDVANLAWKLAATEAGWGDERLLDTYESERRPVALRNTAAARALAAAIGTLALPPELEADDSAGAAARAALRERLESIARREYQTSGVQLGARYDRSPIVWPDGSPAPPDDPNHYVPTARPGSRAPHFWMPSGQSLFDRLGRDFTLLRLGPEPLDVAPLIAAAADRGLPLTVLDIPTPGAAELYQARLSLVRPDQHIAWRGNALPDEPRRLIDLVRGAVAG